MSWSLFTFNVDLKYVGTQLRRIAEALESLIPPPGETVDLKPEEAVTYVDEERDAQREMAEEAHRLNEWLAAQEEDETPEGYGEGDIHAPHESD